MTARVCFAPTWKIISHQNCNFHSILKMRKYVDCQQVVDSISWLEVYGMAVGILLEAYNTQNSRWCRVTKFLGGLPTFDVHIFYCWITKAISTAPWLHSFGTCKIRVQFTPWVGLWMNTKNAYILLHSNASWNESRLRQYIVDVYTKWGYQL